MGEPPTDGMIAENANGKMGLGQPSATESVSESRGILEFLPSGNWVTSLARVEGSV